MFSQEYNLCVCFRIEDNTLVSMGSMQMIFDGRNVYWQITYWPTNHQQSAATIPSFSSMLM